MFSFVNIDQVYVVEYICEQTNFVFIDWEKASSFLI